MVTMMEFDAKETVFLDSLTLKIFTFGASSTACEPELYVSFEGRKVVSTMLLLYDFMMYFPSETLMLIPVLLGLKLMNFRFAFWANIMVVKNIMSKNFFMMVSYFWRRYVALGWKWKTFFWIPTG